MMTEDEMSAIASNIPERPPLSDATAHDVIGIVEWWVNSKHGGDVNLERVVAATVHVMEAMGWHAPAQSATTTGE